MSFYENYRLIEEDEGFTVEIYLDPNSEEFSSEFWAGDKNKNFQLDDMIKKFINENFSDIKINSVKLLVGTMLLGTFSLLPSTGAFAATEATTATSTTSSITPLNTTATVNVNLLNMRTGPSTSYPIMHTLWKGNTVAVIGQSNGWYQIRLSDGRVGWASGQYMTTRQQKVDTVIAFSKSLLGTPYVFGGDSPSDGGFDCSGFTKYVYGHYGYSLNRLSKDQALNGTYVARTTLQPGDLVFYSFDGNGVISHVGIYIGDGQMIHSPKTGDVVKITNVTTSYWTSRYVTARRIIQ